MSLSFNADEVFEMAEEIERNGKAFYTQMSKHLDPGPSRELLESLAQEEAEHVEAFQELRKAFAATEDRPMPDPDEVTQLYLRALADGRVFDEKEGHRELGNSPDPLAILRFAIQREKDSIVYYMGMKEVVPPDAGRKAVDEIIREEMQHITRLSAEILRVRKED